MKLKDCYGIADFRRMARRKLPAPIFHFLDGGAEDEVTLRRNTAALDLLELIPNYMVDVSKIDTKTKLFGTTIDWPVFLAPTGSNHLFHRTRELAVARAAAKMGTIYSLSTMATSTIEEITAVNAGFKMFQIYVFKDRGLTTEFVARCKAAKYGALCLTVDMPVGANRERDRRMGMTLPPTFNLGNVARFAMHPLWSFVQWRDDLQFANVKHRAGGSNDGMPLIEYVNSQFDRTVTWEDAAKLAKEWDGPFVIKGLMSVEDSKRAHDIGATAIMVSNHGGRQLDSAPAPIDCIAPIRDAVGDSLELILDGGVRRGTHVLKALASGANACSIGRAYLYGLAAGGQTGVERVLILLRAEIERDMALLGVSRIADIGPKFLKHPSAALHAAPITVDHGPVYPY